MGIYHYEKPKMRNLVNLIKGQVTMSQEHPKLNIACVEYYNTLPFIYGLDELVPPTIHFDLKLGPPSLCTQMYLNGEVDMALVPVGGLDRLHNDYRILNKTCIGCNGAVDTVAILSDVPITDVTNLYLDPHSNTSNRLVKILCKDYWRIAPTYRTEQSTYDQESLLAIGDKVFDLESSYRYKYDLGATWKMMTGLPFVFAVWIARDTVQEEHSSIIEGAFAEALNHSDKWIPEDVILSKDRLLKYLTKNIVFHFDDSLREGLHLFNELNNTSAHGYRINTI